MKQSPFKRPDQQEEVYRAYLETIKDIECPFCEESIIENQLVEEYDKHWLLTNKFPYPNTTHHYLIVPKVHITKLSQMLPRERENLYHIITRLINKHNDVDILMRSEANPEKSIDHLHCHVIVINKNES